jgi:hypothetical protein
MGWIRNLSISVHITRLFFHVRVTLSLKWPVGSYIIPYKAIRVCRSPHQLELLELSGSHWDHSPLTAYYAGLFITQYMKPPALLVGL